MTNDIGVEGEYGDDEDWGEPEMGEADVSFGALARADALAAGYTDWMNVTRWPEVSR